mmetsp:Transcript_47281/g.77743  ORF Transcript_47281/g.77743 Transcript_47281/m.77743 type:complete len:95 (+) Transcript_47281:42-326(+)
MVRTVTEGFQLFGSQQQMCLIQPLGSSKARFQVTTLWHSMLDPALCTVGAPCSSFLDVKLDIGWDGSSDGFTPLQNGQQCFAIWPEWWLECFQG